MAIQKKGQHSDDDASSSKSADVQVNNTPDEKNVCLYKKGRCKNPRALKRNGKPHTLCEFHRNKQIEYQRSFDKKTRESRQAKRKGEEAAAAGAESFQDQHLQGAAGLTAGKRSRVETAADAAEKLKAAYGQPELPLNSIYNVAHLNQFAADQRALPQYVHANMMSALGMVPPGMAMMPQPLGMMHPGLMGMLAPGVNLPPGVLLSGVGVPGQAQNAAAAAAAAMGMAYPNYYPAAAAAAARYAVEHTSEEGSAGANAAAAAAAAAYYQDVSRQHQAAAAAASAVWPSSTQAMTSAGLPYQQAAASFGFHSAAVQNPVDYERQDHSATGEIKSNDSPNGMQVNPNDRALKPIQFPQRQCLDNFRLPKLPQLQHA